MRYILHFFLRRFPVSIFCVFLISASPANSHSYKLSEVEIQCLDTFFRTLLKTTTAGYVLYGDKPLFACIFKSVENTIPGTVEYEDAIILTEGLKVWNKLKIMGKTYLFLSLEDQKRSSQEIILINKEAFNKVIRENLSLFRFKLGYQIDEYNILEKISSVGFFAFFQGQEALQGILLGYGTGNAITYERGNSLRKAALQMSNSEPENVQDLKKRITDYAKVHGGNWETILRELDDFSFYTPQKEDTIIPKIPFSFHVNSEESKDLLIKYKRAEKRVVSLLNENKLVYKIINRIQND